METIINQLISAQLNIFATQLAEMGQNEAFPQTKEEIIHIWESIALNAEVVYKGKTATPEKQRKKKSKDVSGSSGSCYYKRCISDEFVADEEPPAKDTNTSKQVDEAPKENSVTNSCVYKPKKGKMAGVACGKKAMDGKTVCSTHKKYENAAKDVSDEASAPEPVAKKSSGCSYTITKGKSSGSVCGKPVKSGEFCSRHQTTTDKPLKPLIEKLAEKLCQNKPSGPKKLVLRLDSRTGRHTHKETGFVFNLDKKVDGRCIDGVVKPLTSDDIDLCKENSFAFVEPVIVDMQKEDIESILNELLDDDVIDECGNDESADEQQTGHQSDDVEEELQEDDD